VKKVAPKRGQVVKELVALISHEVLLTSFCKSQFPHKSVNLSFMITTAKNELTDLCGK